MPMAGSTVRGTNAITQIGLLVPSIESLTYWKKRFEALDVKHDELTSYADRDALHFEDSEGLRMILLNNNGDVVPENWSAWEQSTAPQKHRILGMGPVEMTVHSLESLANTLKDMFGYVEASRTDKEAIYQSVAGQSFGEIVIKQEEGPNEKPGKGSIHHLAIRVKNETELRYWDEAVKNMAFTPQGLWSGFTFKAYISVSQTVFYLK